MQTLDWGFNLFAPVVYREKKSWGFLGDSPNVPLDSLVILEVDCWSIILHVYVMEGRTRGLGLGDCMTMG
jgi:hypothetical protein